MYRLSRVTRSCGRLLFVLIASLSMGTVANAETGDRGFSLNGFGGWVFGSTDGNRFLSGDDGGEYDNANFSLAISAAPQERLRISGQIELASAPLDEEEEVEVELDYAFAEWTFTDAFHGRIGRSKHPFGIYAELFDVGTLRPFYDLPQAVYGPTGIAGESYDGIGFTYFNSLASGWDLQLDGYFGSLRFDALEPWDGLFDDDDDEAGDDEFESLIETKQRDETVGLRFSFTTPVSGLSWGVSAYSGTALDDEGELGEDDDDDDDDDGGDDEGEGEGEFEESQHVGFGVHLHYLEGPWSIAAEFTHLDEEEELSADGFYLEVAYKLGEHWQVAARFDRSELDIEEVDIRDVPTLGEHEDLALGINYWLSPELVIKLSVHEVTGNRFALPEEADEAIDNQMLEPDTTLITFGGQFSF